MESQNIEYKQVWKEDYLKWICGFANAQGGVLFIGIYDNGNVCDLKDAKKLMENIPNKVCDVLGIVVDVNLHCKEGKEYLEIEANAHPYPVSYKGQYYYCSGSTKQELKGAALDRFLLCKQGKAWDGVSLPDISSTELDNTSFDLFRRCARQRRLLENCNVN